ncbi:MAG: DUF421 domain-containing protein [Endomicrobiales bacterium]
MRAFSGLNWEKLIIPSTPLLETFIRGTLMYVSLFLLLRLVLKRQSGVVGLTDLLVVVLIADASQNAMAGGYTAISDGLLLVVTIVFWDYSLDWLGYRIPLVQRFVHPPPLLLVKDGQMLRRNMRRELITEGELMSQLREQGIETISEVREAYMEGDGHISIVPKEGKPGGG